MELIIRAFRNRSALRRAFAGAAALVVAVVTVGESTRIVYGQQPAPTIDATAWGDQSFGSNTVATTTFSTTAANELLLAFVSAADSAPENTVTGVAGGGLTWQLVVRANGQRGTSEIWRAFAPAVLTNITVTATLAQSVTSSLTVMSFKGVDTTGTNGAGAIGATRSASAASGAPTGSVTTTRSGSLVLGAGNDWDGAVARTVSANQTMVHQFLGPYGDTFWCQRLTNAVTASGTNTAVSDTAPTNHQWNLSVVEVRAPGGSGDTTAPTVSITAPAGAATVSGSVAVSATATDNVGVVGVQFLLDGANLGAEDTASPFSTTWNTAATTNGPHTLSAVARDAAGNQKTSAAVLVTVNNVDSTAPAVSVTVPSNNATVGGTNVTVTATATDNVGVTSVQLLLDGSPLGSLLTTAPYTVSWNTTGASAGNHLLSAIARDAANNSKTATAITVNVVNADTAAPNVSVSTPANNATVAGANVSVTANASDNVGVASVQLRVDAVNLGAPMTSPPYTRTWNTTGLSDGPHTLTAVALDAAGNSATSAVVNVAVANSPSASPVIDAVASGDRATSDITVTTTAFSTTAGSELLLAFVAANDTSSGNTVSGIAGGGLTWQLVVRTNVQRGTSEIWRAFASLPLTNVSVTATMAQPSTSSITVFSFKGVDTSGSNGAGAIGATRSANALVGAPTGSVTATRSGSLVLGVGNDWEGATARTIGPNQVMVHQYLAPSSDTYWVQRLINSSSSAGATVVINDPAPANHRYNLSIVEVVPGSGVDTTAPAITTTNPGNGAASVPLTAAVTATFSEVMDGVTIGTSTFQLRDAANAVVPALVSYDSSTSTATLQPSNALTATATYTARVTTGAKDLAGNGLTTTVSWTFTADAPAPLPPSATTTPVLVVTSATNAFTKYYSEILRAEGLNDFTTSDIAQVTTSKLNTVDLVILGEQSLTTSQVTMFSNWVAGGGRLIAMRPDKKLASLLGVSAQTGTLADAYLRIDTSKAPGAGLVDDTIQFHGTSDEYLAVEAGTVATLHSDATHPTSYPAVTLNQVGSLGGQAAAFTYDLARSVVYTRQGNPAWAGQERDGLTPIRSDDLFYGAMAGDDQPDWTDLNKVQIPQADEQQRLLANLIQQMTVKPVPRFWYFPKGKKAVVIMTGDDHANGGTASRFTQYQSQSPAGCNVANWDCIRSTSYVYPGTPLTSTQVTTFTNQGFEITLHVTLAPGQGSGACGADFTSSTLTTQFTSQLAQFQASYPGAPTPVTHRLHCLMWSDWLTLPTVELQKGIRLNTTYYYWPPGWVFDQPGMFTGSGMPMRMAGTDGTTIDVYQAVTQMTDESGQSYPLHVNTLLDNALGATGYYGAFTANMHTDLANSSSSDAIVASALARGVPIVSARQMLTWLDGRNGSTIGPVTWTGTASSFTVTPASGATGLQLMVPTRAGSLRLTGVTLNGAPATYSIQTIKGIEYAFVTAAAGLYQANYAP